MIELIRNCSHGSEIATYLAEKAEAAKYIIKVASTPVGIKNLRSEVEGWSWYQSMRYQQNKRPICQVIKEGESYLKIQVEFIDGIKVDCTRGLEKNAKVVKKIIEHYCSIWPYHPNETSPLHGDFSLDNVIYNSEGIHIIDWEHFNPSAAPWGLDALYLLFETLCFGMRRRNRSPQKEINILADSINFLNRNNRLEPQAVNNPLKFTKGFIIDNPRLWGNQLTTFPDKFPILRFTHDQVALIDHMLFSKLNGKT